MEWYRHEAREVLSEASDETLQQIVSDYESENSGPLTLGKILYAIFGGDERTQKDARFYVARNMLEDRSTQQEP